MRSGAEPEQHHLEWAPLARILVPEALDGPGPAGGLLDLVQDEEGVAGAGHEAGGFPLLRDPLGAAQGGLVSAGKLNRSSAGLGHLLHQRGLANLTRAGHDLDEAPWLRQAPGEHGGVRPLVRHRGILLMVLSNFTQYAEHSNSGRRDLGKRPHCKVWVTPSPEPFAYPLR